MNFYEEGALASPFDDIEYDLDSQTGGDWYTIMLAASLGGKNVEGVASSGSSEVIMKVDYDFAAKKTTGKIKFHPRNKVTPAIDEEGKMVAKLGKKFRGVGKANSFSLVTEDSLWSSAGMNRVKSAAFLAASMIAMGSEPDKAREVSSDILGEAIPESIISSVSVPLSIMRRDAAVVVKARNAVFLPHHVVQNIVWEDGALESGNSGGSEAIDWGRITAVAKYLGSVNAMVDPTFELVANKLGVPYALIDGHWASVTRTPYLDLMEWKTVDAPSSSFSGTIEDAERLASMVHESTFISANVLSTLSNSTTATELLAALARTRIKKRRPALPEDSGTDVLKPVVSHSINPLGTRMLVLGAESSNNAMKTAMIMKVEKTGAPAVTKAMSALLIKRKALCPEEGVVQGLVKEIAEKLITPETFQEATAILARTLQNVEVATRRMAAYKRSVLGNSSALGDRIVFKAVDLTRVGVLVVSVSKAIIEGNRGILLPPAILANPEAAIRSGRTLELLREAREYLDTVKSYWSTRYTAKANSADLEDTEKMIHYQMAAKAMKNLKAEWLIEEGNSFLPLEALEGTYLMSSVSNYIRKRAKDAPAVAHYPGESAIAYARRMDILLKPVVPFESSVNFVATKMAMVAKDFQTDRVWQVKEEEEEDEEGMADFFASMFTKTTTLVASESDAASSWTGHGDPEEAAKVNGYASFSLAYAALSDATCFDAENRFTSFYLATLKASEDGSNARAMNEVI